MKIIRVKKTAQVENQLTQVVEELFREEKDLRQSIGDISRMDEWTPEDGPYGDEVSSDDFENSLSDPFVDIINMGSENENSNFHVTFHGNYNSSSVNAGMSKTISIGDYARKDIIDFLKRAKVENWKVEFDQNGL